MENFQKTKALSVFPAILFIAGCSSPGGVIKNAEIPVRNFETQSVSYHGWMPCNNCDSIELNVNLNPETSEFELTASYINHPHEMPDEEYIGHWTASQGIRGDSNAIVYNLSPYYEGDQDYFFMKISDEEIELIAPNLSRYSNGEMMRLEKSRK